MATFFLDSSAVIKRYLSENGTAWVIGIADPAATNDLFLAGITAVEVTSAIVRRSRGGSIPPAVATAALAQFQHDLANQYQTVALSDTLLASAVSLAETHSLRAYDAVQLAAALQLHAQRTLLTLPSMQLISADRELNAAAIAEGLAVDDPNNHP